MVYGLIRIVFSEKRKLNALERCNEATEWATKNILKLVGVEETLQKIGGGVGTQKDFDLSLTHKSLLSLALFWWETWSVVEALGMFL